MVTILGCFFKILIIVIMVLATALGNVVGKIVTCPCNKSICSAIDDVKEKGNTARAQM